MPLDQRVLREFMENHDLAAWQTAFGSGKNVRGVFSGNSDSRVNDPNVANSDLSAPVTWVTSSRTTSVLFDLALKPQDFSTPTGS